VQSLLRRIFDRLTRGQDIGLEVVFADGSAWRKRNREADVTIVFKTAAAQWRTLALGYVGLFEAWFAGAVEILGDRGVGLIMRIAYHSDYRYKTNPLLALMRRHREWRDDNRDPAKARANARHHYGLPHRFFELMLGEDCLYAEGYWAEGVSTLAEAQRQRCDYICRKLRLSQGQRLVEVGSGWGWMAMHAAERYGVEVVNYGLVPEQNRIAERRIEQRQLRGRVRIVERDHRELAQEPEAYDRYVSVGVYEHAGRACQPEWIGSIATALRPQGIGVMSTTSYIEQVATEYLTIRHIFPGGSIPSLARTLELLDQHGLHVIDVEELGAHYRRTAEHWLANFEARWPEIQAIDPQRFDERFRRIWTYYLCGVIEGFRDGGGNLNLHHLTFTKGRSDQPQERRSLYVRPQPSVRRAAD
jgi:cyclopropane-fatty-acyl-phospholipid synthase